MRIVIELNYDFNMLMIFIIRVVFWNNIIIYWLWNLEMLDLKDLGILWILVMKEFLVN